MKNELKIGDKVYVGETVYYHDNPKKGIITQMTTDEQGYRTYEVSGEAWVGIRCYEKENIFLRSDKESVNQMFKKTRELLKNEIYSYQAHLRDLEKLIIEHNPKSKLLNYD